MNIGYSNSTSLITAITSSGKVFAASTKGSVNSLIFLKFIRGLGNFVEHKWNVKKNKCLVILDNASTHRSKETVKCLREQDWIVAFIPPYMPEMAPVEKYFAWLKRMILRKTVNSKMNWQSEEAYSIFKEWIWKIDESEVTKFWLTFTQELRNGVNILAKII